MEIEVRRTAICFIIALWAVPATAQTSLLPTLQRVRAQYPTPMTGPQKGEMLNRVAWEHRAEGWGLLRKTGGTRCPAPQGVEIACDILVYSPTAWHFDVLIDQEGAATPTWLDKGPCNPAVSGCDMAGFVLPVAPPAPVVPPSPTGLGDTPVPGDYNGDGQIDIAVFRTTTGEWFIAEGGTARHVAWGGYGDIPVPADYDGDHKTDLAVYRPSTGQWFILNSSNSTMTQYSFGSPSSAGLRDTPMAGDYDRDGRADLGIYRFSTGQWFIRQSSTGGVLQVQWGAP
jgi:hypothetical protein